jgi:hypothetical protein
MITMTEMDMMADWTPEERAATQGMPPNIAIGFVAARRGTDVREVHNRYEQLKTQMNDLINTKASGGGQVGEDELRQAFEKFSSEWPARPKEEDS